MVAPPPPSAPSAAAAGLSLLQAAFSAASGTTPVQAHPDPASLPQRKGSTSSLDLELSPKDPEDKPAEPTAGWALLRAALNLQMALHSGSRQVGGEVGTKARDSRKTSVDEDDEERWERERAFDIADSLEGGTARETATDFTMPLRRSSRLWRFRILRSEDRLSARMVTESGDFLIHAQVLPQERQISFFLYDPLDKRGLFKGATPAFSLGFNQAHTEWRLVQEHCDHCRLTPSHLSCARTGRRQQLFYARHSRETVGGGICNCIEAVIPGIYSDNTAVTWCAMLGREDLGSFRGARSSETQQLVTALPSWSDEVGSLVMDFKGRNVLSSAKNLQLALRQRPAHTILQFGKLGPSTFGLDFKYPLSAAQAFGLAMTTVFWT
mmetsp:Transcript_101670/g.323003  ORF Transcript_101670/g.323003 Transcript_101670/m.323003 type:complete len:381 (-) Transcript_101670:47-1189(-)